MIKNKVFKVYVWYSYLRKTSTLDELISGCVRDYFLFGSNDLEVRDIAISMAKEESKKALQIEDFENLKNEKYWFMLDFCEIKFIDILDN